jgi:2-C-methyl-D-erythritol 2,4-cyclodiphosphate synthase
MAFRIGKGYDVHALKENIPLIIGGVRIPHTHGLEGHSDADVLIHAIIDALFGALALGDIGQHFPDSSDEYKGIDSKILLKKTYGLMQANGFEIVNLDSTIMMERPKLKDHIPAMRKAIAEIFSCDLEKISIKATTTEKLGFTGREEGVAAEAIVLLESN